jgi:tetratricopeptide (TPR) repeat protein
MQLCEIYDVIGRRQEAVELANEALTILQTINAGQDHADVAQCLKRLAWAKANNNRFAEGAAHLADAVAMLERLHGPDDVRVLKARVDQTMMSHDIAGSEQLLRRAIDEFRAHYGPRSSDLLPTMKMLGGLLQMRNDFDGAEQLFREALELTETIYGRDHPMYLEGLLHIARLTSRRGDHASAAALLVRALEQARRTYGEPSYLLAEYIANFAGFQAQASDKVAAEESFGTSLAMLRELGQANGVTAAKCKLPLCQFLIARNELVEAEQLARECLAADEQLVVAGHWTRAAASSMLGEIRLRQGRFEEAEQLLLAGYGGLEHQTNLPRGLQSSALRRLVDLYQSWDAAAPGQGKHAAADQWRQRLEASGGSLTAQ